MALVGTEKLFSIPLVHPMFKMCPLVFLAMAFHLARTKVFGEDSEEVLEDSDGRGPRLKEGKVNIVKTIKKYSDFCRPFMFHSLVLCALLLVFVEWKEYGVFTLIRFALCAVFVRLSWEASRSDDARWVWIWGILAAAYNPFVPLSLGRSVWVWVNWGTIGTVIFDVIRRSQEPLKTLKLTLMLGAFLAVLWGITVGGKYYFSEVLPEQQAKAAERQELEAHEKTWSGEEQRKRSDDN